MPKPGEVYLLHSQDAGKKKFHLCIHINRGFLYLNSPKVKIHPGDLILPNSEFPFLPPTETGDSIISCNLALKFTPSEFMSWRPKLKGCVSTSVLHQILEFVEATPAMSEEDKEFVLDGLGDWL